MGDSNTQPSACKTVALPIELISLIYIYKIAAYIKYPPLPLTMAPF